MPTMSSLRSKPSFTPVTMFATSARARPCSARILRSSPLREMTSWLPSSFALSPARTGCVSLPFGPSARTTAPSICTFTPWGMLTGFRPIRDIDSLPHVGEHFAADLLFARVPAGHHAPRRRHQRHPHAGHDGRDLVVRDVHAPTRGRDADEPGDHLLVADAVLEIHTQGALLVVLEHAVVLDEALVLQDLGDPDLELGGRNVHLFVLGAARVADARQEIGDRIASHGLTSSPSRCPEPRP